MPLRNKLWLALLAVLVLSQAAVSLLMPRGDGLTIANDVIQGTLLLLATAAFFPNTLASRCSIPRVRLFWIFMTAGMFLWLAYQGLWNYFEVIRRQDVPNPFAGDVVLFLHLVPMIAALALRPHQRHQERNLRIGMLNFSLLLTWWVFLYVYTVIPWQYVVVNESLYSGKLNQLYLTEKLVLLISLVFLTYTSHGGWRHLYAQLLGASALYASSSYVANWAIGHQIYYSGSIYDVPLTVSIAWIAILGKFARLYPLTVSQQRAHSLLGVWVTRVGMLAVFSLPWFALHAQFDSGTGPAVVKFRILLCVVTMVVMGALVFWRQHLLGTELEHLLESSRRSFQDLQGLQAQLIQSEKLASLGRLVGGAAHEINNPLTAMLGYSDLLGTSGLPAQEGRIAARIGEQVRRTKTLVASLLTFAHQAPARMSAVDLNSILQTAMRLIQPQLDARLVTVRIEPGPSLPPVLADSNQILHVCLHLAGQTIGRLDTDSNSGLCILSRNEVATNVVEFQPALASSDGSEWIPFGKGRSNASSATLSLSACCRIVEEHGGRLLARHGVGGPFAFRLELPVAIAKASSSDGTGSLRAVATSLS